MGKKATFIGQHIYLDTRLFKPCDLRDSIEYKINESVLADLPKFLEKVRAESGEVTARLIKLILEEFNNQITAIIVEPLQISLNFVGKSVTYEHIRQKTVERIEMELSRLALA